jgi:hypothetical protein
MTYYRTDIVAVALIGLAAGFLMVQRNLIPGLSEPAARPLAVVFSYSDDDFKAMRQPQKDIRASKEVQEYLESHCIKGDGAMYCFIGTGDDVSMQPAIIQALFAKNKGQTGLAITNGISSYQGPWSADSNATLALLKKYGGP